MSEIQKACQFLARRCDGAINKDSCGFNKYDAAFGRDLAMRENWTSKQAIAAQNLLRKYHSQLKNGGFDVDVIFKPISIPPSISPPSSRPPSQNQKPSTKRAILSEDKRIHVHFPFDWKTVETVKTIPGRKFHPDKKFWSCPVSKEAVKILQDNGFYVEKDVLSLLETTTKTVDEMQPIEIPSLKRELFPFQKQGVAFIEAKEGRALIGDSMGLGKSIQALAWLALHPEKRPVIILCPASLKLNWDKEIQMTFPDKQNVQILEGTTPYKITAEIIIINYDILNAWVETLQNTNPKVIILDEASYIKSSSAQRTKAAKKLAKNIPHVIALTGTPVVNRPIEVFNIAQIINKNLFPSFWEYVHRYCGAKHNDYGWDFSGATNKKELHQKLVESIMIRRKKEDVLKDLPDKVYSYVPMEITNKPEYQKAERDFISYLKLKKGDEAARKASNAEHLVRIEALKQLAIKGKMKQAIEWIQNFIGSDDGDSKLVVFTTHKDTINQLMEEFKDIAVKVDGSVNVEDRNKAVEKFQNDQRIKLFVGNIQAAGVGLTLTAASSVAFIELDWVVGNHLQAEDRCHRIGQKNTVNVYYLLARGTIEEEIAQLLDEKRSVLDAVLDGKETEESSLLTELIKKYQEEGE